MTDWNAIDTELAEAEPNLTQMPDPFLDGISRPLLIRELRGAIWVAQQRVRSAEKRGDKQTIKHARQGLAALYWRARSEKVKPFYGGGR